MRELTVITHVPICDATFQQEADDVGVLRFVWSVELCRVVVHPNFELLLRRLLVEVWWSLPLVEDSTDTGVIGVIVL